GNRTSEQIDDAVTSSTYDRLNHLGSQQGGGPVVFKGSVNEPATVTVNSRSATVTLDNRFEGKATLAVGTTTVNITANDLSGNAATAVYEVDRAASGKPVSCDANGNLNNDSKRIFEREAADDSGTIQARYDYAPFGAATKVTGSGSDVLEYTGAPVHEASGLFLMKRRAYDPAMARWLSEDPIGLKAGPNLYAYVVNDPLRWIDPEGTRIVMPLPWLPNGNVGDWYNL